VSGVAGDYGWVLWVLDYSVDVDCGIGYVETKRRVYLWECECTVWAGLACCCYGECEVDGGV
jgi:hypothetical protein